MMNRLQVQGYLHTHPSFPCTYLRYLSLKILLYQRKTSYSVTPKLLMINSTYRVMVFTSLPYADEVNGSHIENRVRTLAELVEKSAVSSEEEGILLVHIYGFKEPNKQVQTQISDEHVTGFIIDNSGGYQAI